MRHLQALTETEANRLGQLVEQISSEDGGKPVSYAIVDVCGDPILAYRIDGASADSFWIALNKARTAVRAGKDTVEIAHEWAPRGPSSEWRRRSAHEHRFDDNRRTVNTAFVSWAGGVVLAHDSAIVGALAVSGRDELEDHKLAAQVREDWYRERPMTPRDDDHETELIGRLLLGSIDLTDADVDRIWDNLPSRLEEIDPERVRELAEAAIRRARGTS